jgi:hypothetical protein
LLLESLPKHGVCAEIGVWKGRFSQMILEYAQPKRLYLIDPWSFQPEFAERKYGGKSAEAQDDMEEIYRNIRETLGARSEVEIIRDYSTEAAEEIPDGSLDWVYIDGNHHYDYVKEDLETYHTKVKKNGYIIGDDYQWGEEHDYPVKRAVDEFIDAGKAEIQSIDHDQFLLKKQQEG